MTGKIKAGFWQAIELRGVNRCSYFVSSLDNGTFLSIMEEEELILKML